MSNLDCPNLPTVTLLSKALAAFLTPSVRPLLERRFPEAVDQAVAALVEAHGPEWREKMLEADDRRLFASLDVSRCEPYFAEVVAFAKKTGRWGSEENTDLRANLERLVGLSRDGKKTVLYKDFAPHSFGFHTDLFEGGCIFHGKHDNGGDGSAPTFSVSMEPCDGWSIHT